MALRIATNVASIDAQNNLDVTRQRMNTALARLSSGYRINKAADDAAGLAISEQLKAQIRGLGQADRNAHDGVSMIQVAEGGLNQVSSMLIRLRELAVQASSDTVGDPERHLINVEVQQLKSEIQRISDSTQFDGRNLLDGTGGIVDIQVGTNNDPFLDRISFDASAANSGLEALGIADDSCATKEGAQTSLGALDKAIFSVSAIRANFGAMQNRLQSTIANLGIYRENLSAANSRIRDTDVAAETAALTRNQVLLQAGISVLQHANNIPEIALKLLS